MTLEDVIEALNIYIYNKRREMHSFASSHLVLQRVLEPHETFKSYKRYSLILWIVVGNDKQRLLTLQYQYNVKDFPTEECQKNLIKDLETKFITDLLALIIDGKSPIKDRKILEDILYEEYLGYCNE